MSVLISAFLLLLSVFFFKLGLLLLRLHKAEKSMTWKPNTCSKNADWAIKMDCADQRRRWHQTVWDIATRR